MAGPSIGTWVKVRGKSGGTTPRVLAKKYGGGSYQQGQVITQSEYNAYKEKRADVIRSGGSNQQVQSSSLSDRKGQGLLFDTRDFIAKDAISKEQRKARIKLQDLREAKRMWQDEIKNNERNELTIARYQSRVARINQQIKKVKDVAEGRKLSARVTKGTVDYVPDKPNRDKSTKADRLSRVKKARQKRVG